MMRTPEAIARRFRTAAVILSAASVIAGCGERDRPDRPPDPRQLVIGSSASVDAELSYPAPDIALPTLGGEELAVSDFRGRVILVNFWATWCGPCLREIPDLVALAGDVGSDRLAIVGIALNDPDSAGVAAYVVNAGVTYPVILDPDGQIADAFGGVFVMPTTYLISPDGNVVRRISGLARPDTLNAAILRMTGSRVSLNPG